MAGEVNYADYDARMRIAGGSHVEYNVGALTPGAVIIDASRNMRLSDSPMYAQAVNVWDSAVGPLEVLYPLKPLMGFAEGMIYHDIDVYHTMHAIDLMKGRRIDDLYMQQLERGYESRVITELADIDSGAAVEYAMKKRKDLAGKVAKGNRLSR